MPRKLDPAFVEQVRGLAAKGYNQSQIAAQLKSNQPCISYVMKIHQIKKEKFGPARLHAAHVANSGLRAHLYLIAGDGTQLRVQNDATPEQLHALADYMVGLRERAALLFTGDTQRFNDNSVPPPDVAPYVDAAKT